MLHSIYISILVIFTALASAEAQQFDLVSNVSYGSDPEQLMDIYFPSSETVRVTKVVILVHGGAWGGGQKADMLEFVPFLQRDFPNQAIANMDYRLGTLENPGFPKQLEDIDLALTYLRGTFTQNVTFALFGTSAGGHLSMLYGYWWDATAKNVKVIVSHVGPGDLTDPSYSENALYAELFFSLVGPCVYADCPELYNATSPITYLRQGSTPTIGFYGTLDLLVPSTQMPILRAKLDQFGVVNKFTVYQGGHGWNWNDAAKEDLRVQITQFFHENW